MILFLLVGLCLISVPLTGGRLRRLADLQLRGLWLAPLALAVQVVITVIAPDGQPTLHAGVHIATYAMIGIFLAANRRLPGVWLIASGTLSNALAIVLNGGIMPAAATADRIAGITRGAGFHNSAHLAHPLLIWLGDIIPVPGPLPNVMSIGDCAVFAGMLVLLHRTCARRRVVLSPAGARGVGFADELGEDFS
ncbi:MAG: DUF5317 domain-containing protein [Solirubrobacteraceae bacterium]